MHPSYAREIKQQGYNWGFGFGMFAAAAGCYLSSFWETIGPVQLAVTYGVIGLCVLIGNKLGVL